MAQYPGLRQASLEVPYTFQARTAGTSKATLSQGGKYLWSMLKLRYWIWAAPFTVRPPSQVNQLQVQPETA
jgi:hypothetical protein